jgi:hypothetical protein
MNLDEVYELKCKQRSDINEHLPTLKRYAEECSHVTEMGVRSIVSTYGLLAGRPEKMVSIDITHPAFAGGDHKLLNSVTKDAGINYTFILGDTRKVEIEETELLFIDTHHSYGQLQAELAKHGSKVSKYIILHDTQIYGFTDMGNSKGRGLMPALYEFMELHQEWFIKEHFDNNNGLTVVARS